MYSQVAAAYHAHHRQAPDVSPAVATAPPAKFAKSTTQVNHFPEGFLLGASTGAYQVEGAWDEDGRGESIWDRLFHSHPTTTPDRSNGDVAADSYHNYQQDIRCLKEIGATAYRFSISWTRILPKGTVDSINEAGIEYYNRVIDELLDNGIKPLVTMYHWDLPQRLQDLGGWTNPVVADYFVDYAKVLFDNFGDRVRLWTTINDPSTILMGYSAGDLYAPRLDQPGVADYLAARTLLLAHARAYRLYQAHYKHRQGGLVGITLSSQWYVPASDSPEDGEAFQRCMQFEVGLFGHPIFTQEGDFPAVVRQRVDVNSRAEGLPRSRLPAFSPQEIMEIRGSADFLGLNHYMTMSVANGVEGPQPSKDWDACVKMSPLTEYKVSAASWLRCVPWGIRKVLRWLSGEYPGYPIVVTENGWADTGELQDDSRITYYAGYLSEVLRAVNEDGVNVIGYFAWSLLDNLEWFDGYTLKFGLYQVDFDDPERPRKAKASAQFLGNVYKQRQLPVEYFKAS